MEITIDEFKQLDNSDYEVFDEISETWVNFNDSCYASKITGFPNIETADAEIVMISMIHVSTKQCFTFASRNYAGNKINSSFLNCGDEKSLLKRFIEFWNQKNVEVITGWNVEGFDIPFIVNRINRVLGESAMKQLSPWGIVEVEKKRIAGKFGGEEALIVNIAGVTVLDYMALYKKFVFVKHESYSLGHIAQEELGETKLNHDEYANFNEFYEKGFDLFTEYNVRDVELVSRLEDKLKLIELAYTLAYLAKINFIDVFGPVKMWDAILHNKLLSENTVVPLKEHNADGDKHIEGAYVKDPQVGFHEWIVSLDATSLYPSIMMTLNISPETYLGKMYDVNLEDVLAGKTKLTPPSDEAWSPTGTRFSKVTRGVIPRVIEEFMGNRKKAKKDMLGREQDLENAKTAGVSERDLLKIEADIAALNNLQMALKIGLNQLYGAMCNKGFRFFNTNIGETITLVGQYALRSIQGSLDDRLNKIFKTDNHRYLIYVDTDSVVGDTIINVNGVNITIEDYYNSKTEYIKRDEIRNDYVKRCYLDVTPSLNTTTQTIENKGVSYVMKHRVKKRMFKIKVGGKEIICTNDHSIIVRRNGIVLSLCPNEIKNTDELIHIKNR